MISTASSTGFTASTARLTVPLLVRPAARPASRARRTGSSAPMHRWGLTIFVAAVVLGVAILLGAAAILADVDTNPRPRAFPIPMDRQHDFDALLDKTVRDAAEAGAGYLRPLPEPFKPTRIREWRALLQTTLDRVDIDYLSL